MKNKFKVKGLLLAGSLLMLMSMTGCQNPRDEEGNIKLITDASTFMQTFKEDNWFQGIFVYPMSKAMNSLAPILGAVGAVAVVTIIAQVVIFLLTRKSSVASQKMQQLQPEMDRIQRKYEGKNDDASKMRQANEIQALYKKYDINPFASILVMFIQMPLIFAIFLAVQRADRVVNGTFWGMSLSQSPWDGIKQGQWLYIVLFVVMIICQLGSMMLPQYLAKQKAIKSGKKAPANNQMQQTMYMSMGLILVLSIMWPTAMITYWIVSSLVNIVKTLLIQFTLDKKTDK